MNPRAAEGPGEASGLCAAGTSRCQGTGTCHRWAKAPSPSTQKDAHMALPKERASLAASHFLLPHVMKQ